MRPLSLLCPFEANTAGTPKLDKRKVSVREERNAKLSHTKAAKGERGGRSSAWMRKYTRETTSIGSRGRKRSRKESGGRVVDDR